MVHIKNKKTLKAKQNKQKNLINNSPPQRTALKIFLN